MHEIASTAEDAGYKVRKLLVQHISLLINNERRTNQRMEPR